MQTRPRPVAYRAKNKRRKISVPGPTGVVLKPHQILLKPLVTEKGTFSSTRYNSYTFMVNILATKPEIRGAIEELFNVRVTAVNTQIRHGKKRRWKNKEGVTSDWKKAIVTLNKEDKIEFY